MSEMVEVINAAAGQSSVPAAHVVEKFAAKHDSRRTMVIGHRGGFFGPENSMKGF